MQSARSESYPESYGEIHGRLLLGLHDITAFSGFSNVNLPENLQVK